ncbi:glycosyltransferase family 2 protein [Falsirhodobacter algicola]|uniref:Glycosyltransferase n=1 Tax=Falsirhodobacter algicola TaxID=2692330 RepID=A0A8J8MQZ3_9RHOB|nr:glycosyltransferase [Falsirhodobacter algicola]QUS35117.1 glycosyltransferase [Falsirhodobacter algicola]
MTQPRISVLINNYNYGAMLGRAIDSALAQTGPTAEVIVVDDGSSDGSRAVIEGYGAAITAIFQPNGGQASAMNAAVRASRGEILCFLDADDWWRAGKTAAVAAAFDADPALGLVFHRLVPTASDGRIVNRPIPRTLCEGDLAPRMARSGGVWPFPMTSAISVRRSAWDAAGPIPEGFRISADAWLVGIIPFLRRVRALPEVLGHYRIHDNTWHRADDAAMLRRRMDHWARTVTETNAFMAGQGLHWRLDLADHFPHRLAGARLARIRAAQRLTLLAHGLRFGGEPHPLRRGRDALRVLRARPVDGAA